MDTLLTELHEQESRYHDSLLKGPGLDVPRLTGLPVNRADRVSSSRNSLRAELERARAEQLRLQEAARSQSVQLEQLRSQSAAELGSLESRVLEQERLRREEAAQVREPGCATFDERAAEPAGRGGRAISLGAADGSHAQPPLPLPLAAPFAQPGSQPGSLDLAVAVSLNSAHIGRIERAVDELRTQLGSIDAKLAHVLALGSPARDTPRSQPRSRSLFVAPSDADVAVAAPGGPHSEADAALRRLSQMTSKYNALKEKLARQTIREAELHGFLLTQSAQQQPPSHGSSPADSGRAQPAATPRPASERRARGRTAKTARSTREGSGASFAARGAEMASAATVASLARAAARPASTPRPSSARALTASTAEGIALTDVASSRLNLSLRVPVSTDVSGKENGARPLAAWGGAHAPPHAKAAAAARPMSARPAGWRA
ncbi:hypothetical protein T492DRAFT_1065043 [Pavlovales sp. CCMP2436]|nr:hypothetical protein T492DRAFT_1065043 [Pavlovales sp. CCMP2436]